MVYIQNFIYTYMKKKITPEDAHDRTFWKSRIRAADPT